MDAICSNCGNPIPDGSKFCPECGTKYEPEPAAPKCAYCGAQLKATSKFCPKCGKTVGAAPVQPQQTAQPAQPEAPTTPKCSHCGAELKATSKFCSKCGRTVITPAVDAAPTVHNEATAHMQQQAAQRGVRVATPINNTADARQQSQPRQPFQPAAPQAPKCAYCGAQMKATSKFCPKCGKTVSGAATSPAASPIYTQQSSQPPAQQYQVTRPANAQKRPRGLFYANIALAIVCVVLIILAVITIPLRAKDTAPAQTGGVAAEELDENTAASIRADYDAIAKGEFNEESDVDEEIELSLPHTFNDWAQPDGEQE